jgi:hypothetical protein
MHASGQHCIMDIEILMKMFSAIVVTANKRAQEKNSNFISSRLQIFPMPKNVAILLLLCVLHIARANDTLTVEVESDELMKTSDLEQAETKDASATEIIKQIRKLNPDGTFTIGFEAVSFGADWNFFCKIFNFIFHYSHRTTARLRSKRGTCKVT